MQDNKNVNTNDKKPLAYKVPKKGSLGLLAAGYKGVRAWRKAMSEAEKSSK